MYISHRCSVYSLALGFPAEHCSGCWQNLKSFAQLQLLDGKSMPLSPWQVCVLSTFSHGCSLLSSSLCIIAALYKVK